MSKAKTLATTVSTGNVLADGTVAYSEVSGTPVIGTDIQAYDADTVKYDDELTRPDIRPSLNLDFANTKRLDPRITFTRSTTASYYDGVTTAKAEENLIVDSENFRGAANNFVPLNLVASGVADVHTAPDGTTTADALTPTTTNAGHRVRYGIASENTYTFSVFVKPNGLNYVAISDTTNITNSIIFNITSGSEAIQSTNGTATNGSITQSTNGYWRISATIPFTAQGPHLLVMQDATTYSYAGDDTNGIYVWGAQLEQRSAVTAYTPTTTQPITNYIPVLQTAASGVARFDHNPTTGESLGLLVEEQRTNLLTYSEEFDNAAWTKYESSITPNTIVSSSGILSADKLVETTTSAMHFVRSNITSVIGVTYTSSIYLKASERTSVVVIHWDGLNFGGVSVNLLTGVLSTPPSDLSISDMSAASTVTNVGNGWYRVSISRAQQSTTTTQLRISLQNEGNGVYTGDGYSGVYIWGAQLEAGAFPTSYIPTTSATVTRNADAASMTGTNFSSWFNNAEGTIYTDYKFLNTQPDNYSTIFEVDDGTSNNRIFARYPNYSGIESQIISSGSGQASLNLNFSQAQKIALAYKVNDFAACRAGGSLTTDTFGTVPLGLNAFYIGDSGSAVYMNGTIKKIAYYPSRLSNAQLQALTS